MNVKNRLRNNLVRKLQQLPAGKLAEIHDSLKKIKSRLQSKNKTLKLAGSWKDIDHDFFNEMTENLHDNRTNERQLPERAGSAG